MNTRARSKQKSPLAPNQVDKMPPNQISAQVMQHYSGPIPPASELLKFDEVMPGLAERLVIMAEKNQTHQIFMERTAIESQFKEGRRGQICGLIITLSAFAASILAMYWGNENAAIAIGGTTVAALGVAFIRSQSSSK